MPFSRVQNTGATSNSSGNYVDVPASRTYTAGNLVVVLVEHGCVNGVVVDYITNCGTGNNFEKLGSKLVSNGCAVETWWCVLTNGFTGTIRAVFTGANQYNMASAAEYSFTGTLKTPTLTGNNTGTAQMQPNGSVTTVEANAMLIGLWGEWGTVNYNGYTDSFQSLMNNAVDFWSADRLNVGPGTYTVSLDNDLNLQYVAVLGAFEEESAALAQSAFRLRNDDNDEANATWAANENTNLTAPAGTKRVRGQLNNTGDPASITPQWMWRHKPSGGSFGPARRVR